MRTLAHLAAAFVLAGTLTACANEDPDTETVPPVETTEPTPSPDAADEASKILSSTAWETTGAKDAQGKEVPLTDAKVKAFVGYAYFHEDQTFTMYNLDDSPKLTGEWTISPDGKTRTITGSAPDGTSFTRDVEIKKLNDDEFTYRIYPDSSKKDVYFDIAHTPTDHPAPEKHMGGDMGDHDMGDGDPMSRAPVG